MEGTRRPPAGEMVEEVLAVSLPPAARTTFLEARRRLVDAGGITVFRAVARESRRRLVDAGGSTVFQAVARESRRRLVDAGGSAIVAIIYSVSINTVCVRVTSHFSTVSGFFSSSKKILL